MPGWTKTLTPVSGSGLAVTLEADSIDLARATLEIIQELGRVRADLERMRARYPILSDLLDGRSEFPHAPA
jgi:hypothetical protein